MTKNEAMGGSAVMEAGQDAQAERKSCSGPVCEGRMKPLAEFREISGKPGIRRNKCRGCEQVERHAREDGVCVTTYLARAAGGDYPGDAEAQDDVPVKVIGVQGFVQGGEPIEAILVDDWDAPSRETVMDVRPAYGDAGGLQVAPMNNLMTLASRPPTEAQIMAEALAQRDANGVLSLRNPDAVFHALLAAVGGQALNSGVVLPDNLSIETCAMLLRARTQSNRQIQFHIADIIRFAERQWGEMYTQAVEITGIDEGTLRNWVVVANAFSLERRRDDLSFTHHQAVAKKFIPASTQDVILADAALSHSSTRDLEKIAATFRNEVAARTTPKRELPWYKVQPTIEGLLAVAKEMTLDDQRELAIRLETHARTYGVGGVTG